MFSAQNIKHKNLWIMMFQILNLNINKQIQIKIKINLIRIIRKMNFRMMKVFNLKILVKYLNPYKLRNQLLSKIKNLMSLWKHQVAINLLLLKCENWLVSNCSMMVLMMKHYTKLKKD